MTQGKRQVKGASPQRHVVIDPQGWPREFPDAPSVTDGCNNANGMVPNQVSFF